ncbi:glucosidase (plasmid) [Fulvitalea axinellae]|uniref:Glucosidase n=1 Tax=Fulvitalea axinellae TaxID=1182444 RepID=A0AAU9CJN2_9BACT|nr:glucosidase [Fulvitalea axinellae]
MGKNAEEHRLEEHYNKENPWLKWGPYLSERQWGTVREDYSKDGDAWNYFPHDHARKRTYRWGEDGIAGISDDWQRICFSVALWNGKDNILKERLFGLTGEQGNHGEDVKELYYYLDNTPSHAYMKYLYKYPHATFPYDDLLKVNRERGKTEPEYELLDTGVFEGNRYFDVLVEYAKSDVEDICVRITVSNRAKEKAYVAVLPTLLMRNLWAFGMQKEKSVISLEKKTGAYGAVSIDQPDLGKYHMYYDTPDRHLFTDNETNKKDLYGQKGGTPFTKDAFHKAVVGNDYKFLEKKEDGSKFSPLYEKELEGGESFVIKLRLCKKKKRSAPFKDFEDVFSNRIKEADEFYKKLEKGKDPELSMIQRQAFAGMLWSKQYFNIDIEHWLDGDEGQPRPPEERLTGRNSGWRTLNNEDIISMPDKWEYPWYAAWDLAFHCLPIALIDPRFAKDQLILIMREWYMAPNGQIPAYEWNFSDVNPPVHAWAALKVFEIERDTHGKADIDFLKRVFQKLMLNFTWWVNRKDSHGKNVFEGGFLGLDNIGVFDRSKDLPHGGKLEQADGTSWMGLFSLYMMKMAIIICKEDDTFEDVATKFFEHFVYISEAINRSDHEWVGAWDSDDGFFYDVLQLPHEEYIPIKVRSLVGLSPLFAVTSVTHETLRKIPDFMVRLEWFYGYRRKLNKYLVLEKFGPDEDLLFSLVNEARLKKLITALLDEDEFLGKGGIRSLSKIHKDGYHININGEDFGISYQPGESDSYLFGGNSNWRGPVWMPMNYLLIHSLREYHKYYGDNFKVEYPTRSGVYLTLDQVADELSRRLIRIFRKDADGNRPVHDKQAIYRDPHFENLILYPEYFHGDTGRAVGASHQTGWTGLVASLIHECGWENNRRK